MVRRNVRRRRRNQRRTGRRSIQAAPPRLSISSNSRNVMISYAMDLTSLKVDVYRQDLKISDIFSFSPNKGLSYQYRECKILGIRFYWQSDNPTSDSGSVCLTVEDYQENLGTDTCNFEELPTYPGSMIRKVWQNVSNRWYPTEPSDREFLSLTTGTNVCSYTVRHSIKGSTLKGRVIALIRAKMRGRSTTRSSQLLEKFIRYESMLSSLNDEAATEPSTSCT